MDKETNKLLKELTNKEHIKIVSRGNKAILYALRIAKKLGKTKVFIQDQGGWITYTQFIKKLKLELNILKTDYGLIKKEELKKINKDSVLLINSLPGYFVQENIETIYPTCKKKNCLVINDISGSIGTKAAKIGDILVCSFGEDKPLNYGKGGLLAVEKEEWFNLTEINEEELEKDFYEKLSNLGKRLLRLNEINKKIKHDLKDFKIIHKNKKGINVIVKFNNDKEKNKIISYCEKNKYSFTICPRYIRVNCDAVSIEVKRL
jgi:dTDP-4-amino-4,6-dideoxygalactose transaminase